jgi:hypothetical protein
MSFALAPWGLSNRIPRPWGVAVLVVVVIFLFLPDGMVTAWTNVIALVTAVLGYRVQQRRTATTATDPAR